MSSGLYSVSSTAGAHVKVGVEGLLPEPGSVIRHPSGAIDTTYASTSGRTRRKVVTEQSGALIVEEYTFDGGLSRLDGPAGIFVEDDAGWRREQWWRDGAFSRLDGPATTEERDGKITEEAFWFDGYPITSVVDAARIAMDLPTERIELEVRYSAFAVLLGEGVPATDVVEILSRGVSTVSGVRLVLTGTPVDWVSAYESGQVAAT